MRTDHLIRALAADDKRASPLARFLYVALAAAFVLAAILFAIRLGPRPDIAAVALDPRFLFKFAVTLLLAVTALALALRLARPGRKPAMPGSCSPPPRRCLPSACWRNSPPCRPLPGARG